MKVRLYPIAISLILALTACATDYTKSEAPNTLRVDGADTRVDLSFIPGSARHDLCSWPSEPRRAARCGDFQRASGLRHRRGHIAAPNRAGQSRDPRRWPLHGDLADLVSGRTLAPADGMPAVNAVQRYLNDRVKQPPTPTP